jgi:hypothetical protein
MILCRIEKDGNGPYSGMSYKWFKDEDLHTPQYGRPNLYDDSKLYKRLLKKKIGNKDLLFAGTKRQIIDWFGEFAEMLHKYEFKVCTYSVDVKDFAVGDFQAVFVKGSKKEKEYSILKFFGKGVVKETV